jgi:hypothetical protein
MGWEFFSVYFSDLNTGFIVGEKGLLLKTVDGGKTWAASFIINDNFTILYAVYFSDNMNGYAVGSFGSIFWSQDGGKSWSMSESITSNLINSVYFTDSITGYVAGASGTIFKMINSGGTLNITKYKAGKSSLTIYPNPAHNKITIGNLDNTGHEVSVSICSLGGQRLMFNKYINQKLIEINISHLAAGMYLVKIKTKSGFETKKILIH